MFQVMNKTVVDKKKVLYKTTYPYMKIMIMIHKTKILVNIN